MHSQLLRSVAVAAVAALLISLSVVPTQAQPFGVRMSQVSGSGVFGDASFDAVDSVTEVTVSLSGLTPGTTSFGHIHDGTCADPGAVVFPLGAIMVDADGTGTVVGTANAPLDMLQDGNHLVMFHAPDGAPISCGDIASGAVAAETDVTEPEVDLGAGAMTEPGFIEEEEAGVAAETQPAMPFEDDITPEEAIPPMLPGDEAAVAAEAQPVMPGAEADVAAEAAPVLPAEEDFAPAEAVPALPGEEMITAEEAVPVMPGEEVGVAAEAAPVTPSAGMALAPAAPAPAVLPMAGGFPLPLLPLSLLAAGLAGIGVFLRRRG